MDVKINLNRRNNMKDSTFIKFPWTKYPTNGVYITPDQIKAVYDLITKALTYKYRYEQGLEYGMDNIEKYNLDNIKVYNSFINENITNVFDPVARDYVLTTLKVIRENSFKNKSVKDSYYAFFKLFDPYSQNGKMLKTILSENPNSFINFCFLFNKCNKTTLTLNSGELKEIVDFYNQKLNERAKKSNMGRNNN